MLLTAAGTAEAVDVSGSESAAANNTTVRRTHRDEQGGHGFLLRAVD
jgi:hypothetical protein